MNESQIITISSFILLLVVFCVPVIFATDCPPNCTNCTGEACTECLEGYGIQDVNGTDKCLPCPSGCKVCAAASSCDTCRPGYKRIQNGDTSNNECHMCQKSYCNVCDVNHETTCDTCKPGFYWKDSDNCYSCVDDCVECNDGTSCTTCKNGYVFDSGANKCKPCGPNCNTCSEAGKCNSDGCSNPAWFPFDTDGGSEQCLPCGAKCKSGCETKGPGKCDTACKDGFYLDGSFTCQACTVERCEDCQADNTKCTKCEENNKYNEDSNLCEYCSRQCLSCENSGPGSCDVCKSECATHLDFMALPPRHRRNCYGFFVNSSGLCEQCKVYNCKNCSTENVNFQCDECVDGYYLNPKTKHCYSCEDFKFAGSNNGFTSGCLHCNYTDCLYCKPPLDLINGRCVAPPPPPPPPPAPMCPQDCYECTNYGPEKCDTCEDGFGVSPGKDCLPCAENCDDCLNSGPGRCDAGKCAYGFFNDGDSCTAINVTDCAESTSINTCDKCMDYRPFYLDSSVPACVPCAEPACYSCPNGPAQCEKCAPRMYVTSENTCAPCKENCLACDADNCMACKKVPSTNFFPHEPFIGTDGILVPGPNATCISPCEGKGHMVLFGDPPPAVCPFMEPYGICAYNNLFRFSCDPTPLFGAMWYFTYYMKNYTMIDNCPARYFVPSVLPPLHFKFNNPLSSYFKDYKEMTRGFMSETTVSLLSGRSKPEYKPFRVGLEIFISSIFDVDDIKMQYTITFWLRLYIFHCEAAFAGYNNAYEWITLDNHDFVNYWMPDVYFRGERNMVRHVFSSPNIFMRLYSDGTLLTSQKITVTIACNMKLQRFPLDKQDCPMQLGSYSYATTDLQFYWKDRGLGSAVTIIDSGKNLPEFDVEHVEQRNCSITDTFVGEYTCLEVHLAFQRKFIFYFEQVYMPSALLVMLSWIGPWVDKSVTGSRVSIGLLTVLTVVTQFVGVNSRLPKVSYIKAVDVWMGMCLVQVVGGMLEYVIVNVIAKSQEQNDEEEEEEAWEKLKESLRGRRASQAIKAKMDFVKKRDKAHYIDLVARVVFPVFFLIFNILYWTYYLAIFTENPEN